MPFVRFSRDRRGYEHTYLIHAAPRRGAPTRILYWYRTPPGIKVGREAFDVEVRRMLEAQYPSVSFDWPKLLETPMPPPEAENWRERRRVERSARQARQVEEPEDVPVQPVEVIAEQTQTLPILEPVIDRLPVPAAAGEPGSAGSGGSEGASKKRRRRGGRRRRRQDGPMNADSLVEPASDTDADALPDRSASGVETPLAKSPEPSASESTGDPAPDVTSRAPD